MRSKLLSFALLACLVMSAPTVQGHAPDVEAVTVQADTATSDAFAQVATSSTQVLSYAGCCDQSQPVHNAVGAPGCCDQSQPLHTSLFTKVMVGVAALAALAFALLQLQPRKDRTSWT